MRRSRLGAWELRVELRVVELVELVGTKTKRWVKTLNAQRPKTGRNHEPRARAILSSHAQREVFLGA